MHHHHILSLQTIISFTVPQISGPTLVSRNIPLKVTVMYVASNHPSDRQGHTAFFCLKMLKENELMHNRNS